MKIYVLSRNSKLYSTKRLVEAGEARGHEMSVIDYLHCNVIIEQGKPSILYKGKLLENPDAIIPRIGASRTFYGCAVVRQFEMMHVFTSVKSQAIVRSRDKLRSMQILSRHGLGLPITAFSSSPDQIKPLFKLLGGPPIIIKLLEGTQGKGVVLADTVNTAKSTLDAFYGLKANILIQEYIKEAQGCDIRVFVVNKKVVASMRRISSGEDFRSNLHMGGKAEKIKLSKAERETALAAADALGLAVAGVDILQSSRGPLIMEVNSSPGLEGIETTSEKNIATEIIRFVELNARKKRRKKKEVGDV
jgi:ribosomal protein S6--L-glutamate ligase